MSHVLINQDKPWKVHWWNHPPSQNLLRSGSISPSSCDGYSHEKVWAGFELEAHASIFWCKCRAGKHSTLWRFCALLLGDLSRYKSNSSWSLHPTTRRDFYGIIRQSDWAYWSVMIFFDGVPFFCYFSMGYWSSQGSPLKSSNLFQYWSQFKSNFVL